MKVGIVGTTAMAICGRFFLALTLAIIVMRLHRIYTRQP